MSDKKSLADSIVKKKQSSKLRKYAEGGNVDSDNPEPTPTDQAQASMRKAFHYPKEYSEGGEVAQDAYISEDDVQNDLEKEQMEELKKERLSKALKSRRENK